MMNNTAKIRQYLRWTRAERVQHWLLAISFTVLGWSGFALTYPDAWWAQPLGWFGAQDLRGDLHRIAATLFTALAVYHLGYLALSRRGREQFFALLPRWRDLNDLKAQVAFNLGRSSTRPKYAHYTYWEKIEYWALIWGAVVMGVTGAVLWFENISLRFLPLWVMELATVIHFYEAILACLAILIWHFYFAIFDPAVYPVNFSMLTGYLTEEEMQHEHAEELSAIQGQEQAAEANAIEP